MKDFDQLTERLTRRVAGASSRRSFLTRLGGLITGAALVPVLPVARASESSHGDSTGVLPQSTGNPQDPGDPTKCDYWRHCAIDGFLCACCGGTASACPPGTEMSPITWIGTCRNPADGRSYVISYNDCCGISSCNRCVCNRNEGDRPLAMPQRNNDTNWCVGAASSIYSCSTAIIIGVAEAPK